MPSFYDFFIHKTESSPRREHSSINLCCILGTPASWDSSFCFSSFSVSLVAVFSFSQRHPPSPSNWSKCVWNFLQEKKRAWVFDVLILWWEVKWALSNPPWYSFVRKHTYFWNTFLPITQTKMHKIADKNRNSLFTNRFKSGV